MPDSGADSGPQVEDGYTRFANELLEALCKWKCSNAEIRLALAVIRLTYGIYGRKSARIETKELTAITDLPAWHIGKARSKLIKRNIIKVSLGANQKVKTYRFNKYYKKWKGLAQEPKETPQAKQVGPEGSSVGPGGNDTLLKKDKKKTKKKEAPAPPPYQKIIDYLNAMTGSKYDHTGKETRGMIRARFAKGYTEQDFYDVIKVKGDQWIGNAKMQSYLRPSTLFRPTNFEDYLQEARRSKSLGISEKQKTKQRRFKIAAAVLRDEGQEACLQYCDLNKVNPEDLKAWMAKQTNEELLDGS